MFDIGFWEISLIMIIALIVVGPERLPKMARTIGLWVGKGRHVLMSVKADIDRELKADELKKMMEKQSQVPEVHEFVEELNRDLSSYGDTDPKASTDKTAEKDITSTAKKDS